MRNLLWLACVAASANGSFPAAKREAVGEAAERAFGATAAHEVAEPQTTWPAFEQGFAGPRRLLQDSYSYSSIYSYSYAYDDDFVSDGTKTWTERGWCSSGLDEHPSTGETTLSAELCWFACQAN